MDSAISDLRIQPCNEAAVRADGRYVLYWMVAFRRLEFNFSLQRAAEWSRELGKPLLILEALRCDYPYASDRLHRFVIDGMAANAARAEASGVAYYPFLEREKGGGKGLLGALAEDAAVVVTDHYPCFFLPRMVAAAAKRLKVRVEKVDSNGLLPLVASGKSFSRAYDFRRFLQGELGPHLERFPLSDPLKAIDFPKGSGPPERVTSRWTPADTKTFEQPSDLIARLPIDHRVAPADRQGGSPAAREALGVFLDERLKDYAERRNQPQEKATSELSPWLHFGHISTHQIFRELLDAEGKEADGINPKKLGQRDNWWNLSESGQAFVDQLVTWRELGFNFCHHHEDYDQYESLPDWARQTLAEHSNDPRPQLYSLEEFESAETHDPLWNAAQTQLAREGGIHNYLRMLWGKKILHWSASPQEALAIMIQLNDKYALDGRDPNSYSGIFWVLGRFDRAWGPERKIFGKIRYMTSGNTAKKYRVEEYLERYRPA